MSERSKRELEAALHAVLDVAQDWMLESEKLKAIAGQGPTEGVRAAAFRAGREKFYYAKAVIDAAHNALNGGGQS